MGGQGRVVGVGGQGRVVGVGCLIHVAATPMVGGKDGVVVWSHCDPSHAHR